MNTLGWFFILAAGALIHGVKNGRGFDAFTDLSDLFIKAVEFDNDGVKEVWGRQGEGTTATNTRETTSAAGGSDSGKGGTALLSEVQRLGKAATGGYSQAVNKRTGPKYYDCSGLVYRGLKNLGYKVPSFWTGTWPAVAVTIGATKVSTPAAGDIVWWVGHMGVMTDAKNFYSALSTKSGIKTVPTSAIKRGKPTYYRLP